jgi:fructokinase
MFIGIDWGGTKIEGVALTKEGKEMIRLRQDTPRHDALRSLHQRVRLTTANRPR